LTTATPYLVYSRKPSQDSFKHMLVCQASLRNSEMWSFFLSYHTDMTIVYSQCYTIEASTLKQREY